MPQVIEMTSVTSASDIWSVGCLAIELLTGQAPYFDLQPMSALFRIVQDAHPPLPQGVSPNMLVRLFSTSIRDVTLNSGAIGLREIPSACQPPVEQETAYRR